MLNETPTSHLVHVLTDDNWNKATRNAAARQIAKLRTGVTEDPVVRVRFEIIRQGVVGRYDRNRAELLRVVAEASGCSSFVTSEQYRYQGTRRRYFVDMFGHKSDIERSISLYKELMTLAVAHMMEITGEGVLQARRNYFSQFLSTIGARLADIGAAPSVKSWMDEHHRNAYAAREQSGAEEYHRELA